MPTGMRAVAAALFLATLAAPAVGLRDEDLLSALAESAEEVDSTLGSPKTNASEPAAFVAASAEDPCALENVLYDHTVQVPGQDTTTVANSEYCRQRCKLTVGCASYTWQKDLYDLTYGGVCYLQGPGAKLTKVTGGKHHVYVSGPKECRPEIDPGYDASCYNLNVAFSSWQSDTLLSGSGREQLPSPEMCRARCRQKDGCKYYSWYQDSGCHFHPAEATYKWEKDAVSGPVVCSPCAMARRQYDGFEIGHQINAKTQEQCRDHCAVTTGCKYWSFWSDGGCRIHGEGARLKEHHYAVAGKSKCN